MYLEGGDVFMNKILSDLEKNTIFSIYKNFTWWNELTLETLKIWFTPPLITTLRVNTYFYNYEDILNKIKTINSRQWNGKFEIFKSDLFSDVIFIKGFNNYHLKKLNTCVLIDKGCIGSLLRGSNVFIPGVLALSNKLMYGSKVSVYGHISNQYTKGATYFDPSNELFLGNGILLLTHSQLFKKKNITMDKGIAIQMTEPLVIQPNFDVFTGELLSMVYAQNLPSIIVGYVVDAKENDIILDMCASPGGKTTHIAQLAKNRAKIIAVDKTNAKVERINTNVKRFSLDCVTTYVYDSCKLCSGSINGLHKNPPFVCESFDKVLLDAPCSGLGQRPYIVSRYNSLKHLESFVIQQKKLFDQAVRLVKVNGFIVYSTCTLTVEENENLIAWALKKYKDILSLVPHNPYISQAKVVSMLTDEESKQVQRFDPIILKNSYQNNEQSNYNELFHDSIGFFIAKFKKIKHFY